MPVHFEAFFFLTLYLFGRFDNVDSVIRSQCHSTLRVVNCRSLTLVLSCSLTLVIFCHDRLVVSCRSVKDCML